MPPALSVLIPVYNAQKYLQQCLTSVRNQTFTDFEIIGIDDGSSDNSLKILQTCAAQEPRLRVLSHANAGVAATRNQLLQEAGGTYVIFVDADDLIHPDYLAKLYAAAKATDADIVKCFFQEINEDGSRLSAARCSSSFYSVPSDARVSRFISGYHDSIVCVKLFRLQWLRDIGISFLQGRVSEDLPFTVQAFMEANHMTVVPEILYSDRKGLTASITSQSNRLIVDWLKNLLDLRDTLQRRSLWDPQVALQWVKVVIWRICAFRKLPAAQCSEHISLQQQAFSLAGQIVRESDWQAKLRWGGLFILVRVFGWRSVYFWTKIFR